MATLASKGSAPLDARMRLRRALHQTQRAQYPLIKEYTLNYRGLYIMI